METRSSNSHTSDSEALGRVRNGAVTVDDMHKKQVTTAEWLGRGLRSPGDNGLSPANLHWCTIILSPSRKFASCVTYQNCHHPSASFLAFLRGSRPRNALGANVQQRQQLAVSEDTTQHPRS